MRLLVIGLVCSFLILLVHPAMGQVRLGIKGGLSTLDAPSTALIILDQGETAKYRFSVADVKYGVHLGMFVQAQTKHFFAQPEFLFNTVAVEYTVEDLQVATPNLVKDEQYRNLDAPLILGVKFGPVRIGAGPVVHLFLDSTSDLKDIPEYSQDFDRLSYGWQAGLGLDIWKLHLDARYEGNFSQFGDHIVFYDRHYHFSEHPSRVLVSAGISF